MRSLTRRGLALARPCLALVALGAALVSLAPKAAACTCPADYHGGSDPSEQLNGAVKNADAIFVGHVVTSTGPDIHGNYAHGTAVLRVLERFKGDVTVGAKVPMPAGNGGGDCSLIYTPGTNVLVYAMRGASGLTSGTCARTRTLEPGQPDLELRWLRHAVPALPRPVALERLHITCNRCNVATVGSHLTGHDYPGCCGATPPEIADTLRAKLPFWAGGYFTQADPHHLFAAGLAKGGSAFQLVETLKPYPDVACTGQVSMRHCQGLKPDARTTTCLHPGPLTPVCDEAHSAQTVTDLEALADTTVRRAR